MIDKKLESKDISKLLDWVNKSGIDFVERSLLKECDRLFLLDWNAKVMNSNELVLDRLDKLARLLRYVREYLRKKYAK